MAKKGKKGKKNAEDPSSSLAVAATSDSEEIAATKPSTLFNPPTSSTSPPIQANPAASSSSEKTEPPSNSIQNGTYPSAASNSYNTDIPTVSTTNGTDALIPPSPYETEIVRVLAGPIGGQREFLVHLGILDRSPSLSNEIHLAAPVGEHDSISLVDTDPVIFELVLRFLYTGKYQKCPYPSQIFPTSEQDDTNKWSGTDKAFELHSLLYCFAREYEMDELSALVQTNIENMTQVPYWNVLDVAKRAYPRLPQDDDDDAYREKFRHETRVAMKENKNITREPWVLDVFRSEHGNLTVDLFTTLTEPLRCDGEAINGEKSPLEEPFSPSQTNKGKEKMVDWGADSADYCIQEPATVPEVEEPTPPPPEETVAVFPEAEYEKCPEPLDPEPESEPEPEPEPTPIEEPAAIADHAVVDGWGFFEPPRKKKGKKAKQTEPEEPTEEPAAIVEPAVYDDWAAWGTKKKVRKGNKIVEEIVPPPEPEPVDDWGTFCTGGKKKKGKKGNNIVEEIVPPPEPEPVDDWGTFSTGGKKKKGKKGNKIDEEIVPSLPEEPPPYATKDLPAEEYFPPEEGVGWIYDD